MGERAHRTSEIPVSNSSWDHEVSRQVDIAWVFLRLCPGKLSDINFERTGNKKMPGWTVFIQ